MRRVLKLSSMSITFVVLVNTFERDDLFTKSCLEFQRVRHSRAFPSTHFAVAIPATTTSNMSQTHPVPQNLQRGDHDLPEFLNARILERNVRLRTHAIGDEFDFSIKKSTPFGPRQGEAFDEGAKWFPLKVVHFTTTKDAVRSFRALYGKGATAIYGKIQNEGDLTVALGSGEYITGVAGLMFLSLLSRVKITTSKTVYQAGPKSGEPFNFEVPTDHHVVGFHGYAGVESLGYHRRLAPASPSFTSSSTDTQPELQPFHSSLCLDDSTRVQWAANNMEAIQQKREQAKADLQPIYTNISDNGENAWVLVESAGPASAARRESADDQDVYNQLGIVFGKLEFARSRRTRLTWLMKQVSAPSVTIALAFANFMQSLVHDGVTWDMSYAATQLSEAISAVGLSDLAKLIPQSVSKIGGRVQFPECTPAQFYDMFVIHRLVVASVLAVALVFALLAFASIVVKEYLLTVNVFNFDPSSTWSSLGWYGDNAELVNGQWENQSLGSFVSSGTGLMPPGFNPAKPQNCMVNYVSTVIRNKSEFLQGLGAAMLFSDTTQGAALKYVVHRAASNAIALKGIPGDPSGFDLEGFYKDAGSWVQAKSTSTQQGTLTITGYTPFLNGAPDDAYEYLVNVGLPSPV
ncbi:hypothetical protein EYR38_009095 [Pleurotus pulmonarius]|nr:hypothetical protein EYR38_009095 [Pleurotus pulmonarius]